MAQQNKLQSALIAWFQTRGVPASGAAFGVNSALGLVLVIAGLLCAPILVMFGAGSAHAQQTLAERAGVTQRPHLSFNGTPGLIDMPSAYAMPDADFAFTISSFQPSTRATLAFQITPRLTGAFRYARSPRPSEDRAFFDRSFEISYQLLREKQFQPAVAIGLRDFGGTGQQEGEFLVASKSFGAQRQVQATLGLGWGRLATQGGFDNPFGIISDDFERRPDSSVTIDDGTGEFELDRVFRGDAAFFGGIVWGATDRLTFAAEYSSDAYDREVLRAGFERKSNYNYGLSYRVRPGLDLGLYYLYGSEVGLRVSNVINPKVPPAASGIEPGPQPVVRRPDRRAAPQAWSTSWVDSTTQRTAVQTAVIATLAPEGLLLESLELTAGEARLLVRNRRFDTSAQALGRTARAVTSALPASVETIRVVLVARGMPTTQTTFKRSDLEDLEFAPDNAWQAYTRSQTVDAGTVDPARRSLTSPRLRFSLSGYTSQSFFDPDAPVLADFGVRASLAYEPRPGWIVDGSLRQPLLSNRDDTNRLSNSVLPFVRSEQDDFTRGDGPQLDRLTLSHYFRPGTNLYGRVTAGYLELAYAGVSSEVLWKAPESRLALGLELNAVHQRKPRDLFALGEGIFDNDAITGHASVYYDFANGFTTQVDVGRYLAEDWGGTFTLTREFTNGWQVGAFATLTDVGFDDFGEGSFDKGIFFTVPTAWALGQPSKSDRTTTLRPVLRDGGAKVRVSNRLYDLVREDSAPLLPDSWGRFWR